MYNAFETIREWFIQHPETVSIVRNQMVLMSVKILIYNGFDTFLFHLLPIDFCETFYIESYGRLKKNKFINFFIIFIYHFKLNYLFL